MAPWMIRKEHHHHDILLLLSTGGMTWVNMFFSFLVQVSLRKLAWKFGKWHWIGLRVAKSMLQAFFVFFFYTFWFGFHKSMGVTPKASIDGFLPFKHPFWGYINAFISTSLDLLDRDAWIDDFLILTPRLQNWLVVTGTFFIFPSIWNVIIPIDSYFSEGWLNHQPEKYVAKLQIIGEKKTPTTWFRVISNDVQCCLSNACSDPSGIPTVWPSHPAEPNIHNLPAPDGFSAGLFCWHSHVIRSFAHPNYCFFLKFKRISVSATKIVGWWFMIIKQHIVQ